MYTPLIWLYVYDDMQGNTVTVASLKAYGITVLKAVYYLEYSIMSVIYSVSVIISIGCSIHFSAQSHIHNKTSVWLSGEESDRLFVVTPSVSPFVSRQICTCTYLDLKSVIC